MELGIVLSLFVIVQIDLGRCQIYTKCWPADVGKGWVVKSGTDRNFRHPQYIGSLMTTVEMPFNWTTISKRIDKPLLVWMFVQLAKRY